MADDVPLTRTEKIALKLSELANERPAGKWLQQRFLRGVSYAWVRAGLAGRVLAEGLPELKTLRPERGVMLVSNHRSFFDQYSMMLAWWMAKIPWAKNLSFPVRANFFYDQPLGILVNAGVGAFTMYPPIYRESSRRLQNDEALDRMVDILKSPNNVLGMHPEGTRGKGDDPYTMLPAQPGVGKLALVAKPTVIPAFINGLGNSVPDDIRRTWSKTGRREHPVIVVFGMPVDYADLMAEKPRPTLYKKCADRFMAEVKRLAARERELRAECLAGGISDDDKRWIVNLGQNRLYAFEG
ncbi:MAG TPA: lysophospholipid acyltransferase family protein [Kofleriaceae bacterium]